MVQLTNSHFHKIGYSLTKTCRPNFLQTLSNQMKRILTSLLEKKEMSMLRWFSMIENHLNMNSCLILLHCNLYSTSNPALSIKKSDSELFRLPFRIISQTEATPM